MNQRKYVFFSAVSGNILEYYDFTVYTIFTLIIGKTYFPATSEFLQTLSSLAVFAVGFVTRPIGGILFGYIGDRYGRRVALICSMLGMTLPTFIMGMIPSYAEIGIVAPVILVICRLLQGLCISGEGAGAAIFVLEHYGNMRPGLVTGLVHGSNIVGTFLASMIGILLNHYFGEGHPYAWRFAFILGGLMGIVGFYLRLRVSETPIFAALAEKKRTLKSPFFHVVKKAWRSMVLTFCVAAVTSSLVYMVKGYVNIFYSSVMHFDHSTSLWYLSYASLILMIAMPISGYFVDKYGKIKILKSAVFTSIFLTGPILWLMASPNCYMQLIALTLLASLAGTMSGAAYITVISLFKPEDRFTGVSFSYNFGIAIFGGTSPIIARWLVEQTGMHYAPAAYNITIAILFLIVMHFMRKTVKLLTA